MKELLASLRISERSARIVFLHRSMFPAFKSRRLMNAQERDDFARLVVGRDKSSNRTWDHLVEMYQYCLRLDQEEAHAR